MDLIGDYLEKSYEKHLPDFREKVIDETASAIAKDIGKDNPDVDYFKMKKEIKELLLKKEVEDEK